MFIVNLRGTSGTGKTTVARALLEKSRAQPVRVPGARRPEAYEGVLYARPLFVLGSYEATCGGMDTVPSVALIAELLHKYVSPGRFVFYEGLLISHAYGHLGRESERYGDAHVFAFLDTPIELCLDRIRQRRLDRGDERPFNPTNTITDHRNVARCRENTVRQNRKVIDVPHGDSIKFVLKLFQSASRRMGR